jgi:Leucine-rich repeat (LRR) protein
MLLLGFLNHVEATCRLTEYTTEQHKYKYYDCNFVLSGPVLAPNTKFNPQKLPDDYNNVQSFSFVDQVMNFMLVGINNYLSHVTSITIKNSQLKEISHDDLRYYRNLNYLEISYNQIKFIEKNLFASNTQLRTLYLNNNEITFIYFGALRNLNKLTVVSLVGNICLNEEQKTGTSNFGVFFDKVDQNCFREVLNYGKLVYEKANKTDVISLRNELRSNENILKSLSTDFKSNLTYLNKRIQELESNSNKAPDTNETVLDNKEFYTLKIDRAIGFWCIILIPTFLTFLMVVCITSCLCILRSKTLNTPYPEDLKMKNIKKSQKVDSTPNKIDVDYDEVQNSTITNSLEADYEELPASKITIDTQVEYDQVFNREDSENQYMEVGFNQENNADDQRGQLPGKVYTSLLNLPINFSNFLVYSVIDVSKKRERK